MLSCSKLTHEGPTSHFPGVSSRLGLNPKRGWVYTSVAPWDQEALGRVEASF